MKIVFKKIENNKPIDVKILFQNLTFDLEKKLFSVERVRVYFNGQPVDKFATNFAGYRYTAEDALKQAILGYINNDCTFIWQTVPDGIKDLKNQYFVKMRDVHDRAIPAYIFNNDLERLDLIMITSGMKDGSCPDYKGSAAYQGDGDACMLLDTATGNCITNMECFYLEGIVEMIEKEKIEYQDDSIVEDIKEYFIDEE